MDLSLYAFETWTITICWTEKVTNENVSKNVGKERNEIAIENRLVKMLWHLLCNDGFANCSLQIELKVEGKRVWGRLRAVTNKTEDQCDAIKRSRSWIVRNTLRRAWQLNRKGLRHTSRTAIASANVLNYSFTAIKINKESIAV